MQIGEKQELFRLLNVYMTDLINDDSENKSKLLKCQKDGKPRWEEDFHHGVKSQYEHARCIANKVSLDIQNELLPNWRM